MQFGFLDWNQRCEHVSLVFLRQLMPIHELRQVLSLLRLLLLSSLFLVASSFLLARTVLEVLLQSVESLHWAWLLLSFPLFVAHELLSHSSSCFCVRLACCTFDGSCNLLVHLPRHALVIVEGELLLNKNLSAVTDLLEDLIFLDLLLLLLQ